MRGEVSYYSQSCPRASRSIELSCDLKDVFDRKS